MENSDIKHLAAWFSLVLSSIVAQRNEPTMESVNSSTRSSVSSVEIHSTGAQTPSLSEITSSLTTKQETECILRKLVFNFNCTYFCFGFIVVCHLEWVITGFIQIIQ